MAPFFTSEPPFQVAPFYSAIAFKVVPFYSAECITAVPPAEKIVRRMPRSPWDQARREAISSPSSDRFMCSTPGATKVSLVFPLRLYGLKLL